MRDYYTRQYKGLKIRINRPKNLWSGLWYDKRKPLFLLLGTGFDDLIVWKISNSGEGFYERRLNCKAREADFRYLKSLCRRKQVLVSDNNLHTALEELGYEVPKDDTRNNNEEAIYFNVKGRHADQVKEKKEVKKVEAISESQWIRARDYQ